MNTITFIAIVWLLFAPFGYIANRWVLRVLKIREWTRMDQMGAIFFSILNGPLTILLAVVFVLLEKLGDTEWAKRDARW